MKRAIVLSGGGSKGSYELGVWKALKKLHISYDIVTGTSIGALNGALMTQKSYLRACYIWHKLSLEYLFNQTPQSEKNVDVFKLFSDNFLKNGGMELEKIETIIKKNISPQKFYKSNIDFGLITYNLSAKKAIQLTKKEIEKEKLVDYLMASATCFPAFQMKQIENEKYVDGGIYDNLPINLALEMGADELIVVDLKAPGIKRKVKTDKPMIIIKPKNTISFFLNFNAQQAKINKQLGYNDTMKAFQKLDGNIFTFKKNEIKNYYQNQKETLNTIFKQNITEKQFLKMLETLGKTFELKEEKIYSFRQFKKSLQKQVKNQDALSKEIKKQIKAMQLQQVKNQKVITLYFLSRLEKKRKIEKALTIIFKKSYEQALLLQQLECHYGK